MENRLLTNYSDITFLETIKNNLRKCRSFFFTVSFIKKAGLNLLYPDIEAAVERGCIGKIITSTYQNFTDIESLKSFYMLMEKNINFECHLDNDCFYDTKDSALGYHSKGYFFEFDNSYELIVGSSNITRYALLKNIEWDVLLRDSSPSQAYSQAVTEFNFLWDKTSLLNHQIINNYANKLNYVIERWDMDYNLETKNIKPNYMQKKALKELNRYRALGVSRALVVSAAGSGKTHLAAFDAYNFDPQKLLYIVHEGSILMKSLATFRDMFNNHISCGIFNGESKEIEADFLFATNLSMSRSLALFKKDEFDYIIIDECHHTAAETYKKIINYFEPEFLLGLTATPERMDNQDVIELFGNNMPFELRLRDAIINDLIVPFKYYGIRDEYVDYGMNDKKERRMIAQMVTEEHCDFIRTEIEKHRPNGKLKALAFCKNVTHARMLSEALGEHYKTRYLTGQHNIVERMRSYDDLQSDSKELEILFTVDILNEGVDIPGINVVLFLRPTESSTIFIQQLGRGLRKYPGKSFVTVLDFIGNNYKRSVQIAFALGSLAKNFVLEKKLMVSLIQDDFRVLDLQRYGIEINIDEFSMNEIINNIKEENFNNLKYLQQDYFNFKKYISSEFFPSHMTYLNNDCAPDLLRFMAVKIDNRKNYSYYNFLKGIEETNLPEFNGDQITFINYLSEMLPLVRQYEYQIIQCITKRTTSLFEIKKTLSQNIDDYTLNQLEHALRFMQESRHFTITNSQIDLNVETDDQFDEYLQDLLDYGLTRYVVDFGDTKDFKLWASYRIDQVQLKLCKNPRYNALGTYVYEGIVYIFASLKKDANRAEHLNYKDKFLQKNLFQWECQAGLNKQQQQELKDSKKAYIFIRKMESENGLVLPFTFVGTGVLTNPRETENIRRSLLFDIKMENELPEYLQFDFKWSEG